MELSILLILHDNFFPSLEKGKKVRKKERKKERKQRKESKQAKNQNINLVSSRILNPAKGYVF